MEQTPNLIYDSFLINDRSNSYRIPTNSDESNIFSDPSAAFQPQNCDTGPSSSERDYFLGDDRFFEDSFENLSIQFNSGFKSCFDPEINDSIRDLNIFKQ